MIEFEDSQEENETEVVNEAPEVEIVEEKTEKSDEFRDIEMKDGSMVSDVRLGRLERFDERSRKFPIRTILEEIKIRKPRSYDWRCLDKLNQGNEGSCVGVSLTHELIARPSEIRNLDYNFAREKIYWEAQKADIWDGGSYPEANPFYEGTSILAGVKAAKDLGYFSEYRWCFGIEDLTLTLGYFGPVVLGLSWYEDMFEPDADGFIYPTGRYAGGHAILATGVNVRKGYITLTQSWGTDWGIKGTCKVKISDMEFLLKDDGEACVPLKRIAAARRKLS